MWNSSDYQTGPVAIAPRPMTDEERDEMYKAYVYCLLWSSTECDEDGQELWSYDGMFTGDDIAPLAAAQVVADIEGFVELIGGADVIAALDYGKRGQIWSNFDLAGHDFCLTRNGHGTGFWDRGLGDIGNVLTIWAQTFGSQSPYASDDGSGSFGVE